MEEINDTNIGGCLPRIRSIYQALTKAEQKVADYILANPNEVVHLSITELAEIAGGAEATIFRLCQKAGFKGYQRFKIALAGDLYTPQDLVSTEVHADDPMALITRKVFHSINEGLQDTLKIISEEALEEAVKAITTARRLDAYGSAGSAVVAADIEYRFMRLGIPVRAYDDPHMQMISAALMQTGDVVIAVSHTGANRDLLDSVTLAKENGAVIIALTSYMKSPLSQIADITLCGSAKETEYRSEAMAARLVHMAIVDTLYVGVMRSQKDKIADNLLKIREAIAVRRV